MSHSLVWGEAKIITYSHPTSFKAIYTFVPVFIFCPIIVWRIVFSVFGIYMAAKTQNHQIAFISSTTDVLPELAIRHV